MPGECSGQERTATDARAVAATGAVTASLLGGAALVALAASGTVAEGCERSYVSTSVFHPGCLEGSSLTTLVTTGTAAAVAGAAGRSSGGLGLDVALGRARGGLVDGLDRDDGLLLTVAVVAWMRMKGQLAWSLPIRVPSVFNWKHGPTRSGSIGRPRLREFRVAAVKRVRERARDCTEVGKTVLRERTGQHIGQVLAWRDDVAISRHELAGARGTEAVRQAAPKRKIASDEQQQQRG